MDINNSLMSAIRNGDLDEAKKLIEYYGVSYSKAWSNGYNLLRDSTEKGHKEITKLLLKSGAKVNSKNSMVLPSNTPLHFAVKNCDVEIIEMLIDRGAVINLKNAHGNTPLHESVRYNKKDITELLLNRGANVNDKNCNNVTPLHIAIKRGCLPIVEYLLKHRACVNPELNSTLNEDYYTPLQLAVERGYPEIAKLLLDNNCDINAKLMNGFTVLHIASKKGHIQIIGDLINHGAYVNSVVTSTSKEGYTPLHLAVETGIQEVIKLLLNSNADVNAESIKGVTPLHVASKKGDMQIVEVLLNHGARINSADIEGYTALHFAVERDRREVVNILLNSNADVGARSVNESTSLFIASKELHVQIAEDLLKHGACVNSADNKGYTPLHIAIEKGRMNIVTLLLSNGADIEANTKDSLTPLYIAVQKGNERIVTLLLDHGVNVDAQDADGKTILHAAVENGNSKIVEHILKYSPDVNNKSNRSSLYFAIRGYVETYKTIVKSLLQYGFTINPEDAEDSTLLHAAIEKGHLEIVRNFLMLGTDVNVIYEPTFEKSCTPLHSAVKNRQHEVAELLINHGAVVDAKDESSKAPIFYAVENCDMNITELLLAKGADIENPNFLLTAVDTGSRQLVELLLSSGANVNSTHDLKYKAVVNTRENMITPLHIASQKNYVDIVETLLEFGADVDSIETNGATALHYAAQQGHMQVVKLLLDYRSDINIVNNYNCTPFNLTACNVNLFRGKFLMVNRNFDDDDGDDFFRSIIRHRLGDFGKFLEKHIVKMIIANLYVCKENSLSIDKMSYYEFRQSCEEEILTMKNEKIGNSNISFQDILTKSASELAVYARNEIIVRVLKSDDFKTKFPIYSEMINSHFRKGVVRKELLEHGNKCFRYLDCFPELPYNCIEKILDHLSDRDLRIFVGVPIRIDKDYVATCYMPKSSDVVL